MLSDQDLKKFASQVEVLQSINFPDIARTFKWNWFRDVKPRLKDTPWFRDALGEALETIKFELVQRMMNPAKKGKDREGSPDITYAKAIISLIDSGSLLGLSGSEVEDTANTFTPEQEATHLSRLGLKDDKPDVQK